MTCLADKYGYPIYKRRCDALKATFLCFLTPGDLRQPDLLVAFVSGGGDSSYLLYS